MSITHRKRVLLISIGLISLLFWLVQTIPQQHQQPRNTTQVVEIQKPIQGQHLHQKRTTVSESKSTQEPSETFQETEFYRVIIDNNLFRPLGWRPPRPRETYRLLGTILPTDANIPKQVILEKNPVGRIYTVTIGETLDTDITVTDIQPKQVTLEKAGVRRTLHLNTTPLLK